MTFAPHYLQAQLNPVVVPKRLYLDVPIEIPAPRRSYQEPAQRDMKITGARCSAKRLCLDVPSFAVPKRSTKPRQKMKHTFTQAKAQIATEFLFR